LGKSCDNGTVKRFGIRKYILFGILLLLIAAIIAAVIHFYPVWNSAQTLYREADAARFAYELEVELDKKELPQEQQKLFAMVEKLTGCSEDAMYRLRIRGSIWEDKIHVLVYPQGMQTALIEMYLSDGEDVVNETALYNMIRVNLIEQNSLLSYLMPEQTDTVYITLAQVEQMFGVDLSGIRSFALPDTEGLSAWQYFAVLAFLTKEKLDGGRIYSLSEEQIQMQLAVPGKERMFPLKLEFSVQDPAVLSEELDLSRISGLFPDLGVEIPKEQARMLKSARIVLTWGEVREIAMPKELVNQDIVELLSGIRELIQKITKGGQ